jgi:hypothetical protein
LLLPAVSTATLMREALAECKLRVSTRAFDTCHDIKLVPATGDGDVDVSKAPDTELGQRLQETADAVLPVRSFDARALMHDQRLHSHQLMHP